MAKGYHWNHINWHGDKNSNTKIEDCQSNVINRKSSLFYRLLILYAIQNRGIIRMVGTVIAKTVSIFIALFFRLF
jgi:hypothetical protein